MTTFLSRSAWTTSSVGGSTLTGLSLVGVAVHWPGTSQAAIGVQSQSATAARIRGYRDFHVGTRGWSDIGYNFAIDQAGRVWMLRSTSWAGNRVGAHCASPSNPSANHKYVGVLLILGQSEQPSTAMVEAFRDWYHTQFLPVWKGRTDVRGHGQVPGAQTNCPGTRAKAKIADLKQKPGGTTPTQEDDMNEVELLEGLNKFFNQSVGNYLDDEPMSRDEALHRGARFAGSNANRLRYGVLPELAAIRAAGADDPAAIAAELAPLVIPPVVAAVGQAGGLTPEQVEEAAEKALRDVLREGVEAE